MSWLTAVATLRSTEQLHMLEALIIVPELKRFSKREREREICDVFTANSSAVSSVSLSVCVCVSLIKTALCAT